MFFLWLPSLSPPQMTKYVTLFSPLLRPGDPWTAALLRAAVPEPTGDAGESLRGAPARPGHSPDASPPHHAPLGCLPGIREAAAPGLYSTYTFSHERCWDITTIWWLFCLECAQNAHKPNLPPISSLNSNSSWSHQLNKGKANEVAQGLPSHVSDSFPSRSGNQSEWHSFLKTQLKWQDCMKAFGYSCGYVSLVLRTKPCIHCGHYSVISLPPWKYLLLTLSR